MDQDTLYKATTGDYEAIATCLREWRATFWCWVPDDYEVADTADQMKAPADALDPAKRTGCDTL